MKKQGCRTRLESASNEYSQATIRGGDFFPRDGGVSLDEVLGVNILRWSELDELTALGAGTIRRDNG
jgi:hypothetical protein